MVTPQRAVASVTSQGNPTAIPRRQSGFPDWRAPDANLTIPGRPSLRDGRSSTGWNSAEPAGREIRSSLRMPRCRRSIDVWRGGARGPITSTGKGSSAESCGSSSSTRSRGRNTRKKYSGVIFGLVLAVLIPGVALAEGSWSSYIINASRGFDSRVWNDRALDGASTTVNFRVCRDENTNNGANDWATVRLWRHAGLFPPYQVGTDKNLSCWVSGTGNWGAQQGAEDFHFQLRDFSGGTDSWNVFDVQTVTVYY